jgi:hypothetical protein
VAAIIGAAVFVAIVFLAVNGNPLKRYRPRSLGECLSEDSERSWEWRWKRR